MTNIVGLVGEVVPNMPCQCKDCGVDLRGDHGFYLDNGLAVCRDTVRCRKLALSRNGLPVKARRWHKETSHVQRTLDYDTVEGV